MISEAIGYIVNNIILPLDASIQEAFSVARQRLKKCGVNPELNELALHRRSVDARNKSDIKLVYSILYKTNTVIPTERLTRQGIVPLISSEPRFSQGSERMDAPIAVIGSGPAGLFSSLLLAEAGYKVVLIERGGSISERRSAVSRFEKERILDTDTNIQFGAGGAGTFSDGKLVTRINDPFSSYVLRRLVEFGAPKEILYEAKPHVGTDVLSVVVDNILKRFTELGGTVHFNTKMTDFKDASGKIYSVITNKGEIACSAVLLAIGHSARDTYDMLLSKSCDIEAKSFSVGMRIEHLTEWIDRGMYGSFAGHPALKHAEYTLSHNTKERGVYTFCMCPGGIVVPAASEDGGVVVNGMSYHSRDGRNSNSAICCSVFKEDYGSSPIGAIEFQRKIERAAFLVGGSDYSAPMITVGDFLSDKLKSEPSEVMPTYMSGGVRLARPDSYLPSFTVGRIKNAILAFDKKISGFANKNATLTGAETRTSAPIRILREPVCRVANGYDNLYPVGEGAGYAGGITSAAIDGIKTAMAIMERYRR